MRRPVEIVLLASVLTLAIVLRLHALGDELWFDEIVTRLRVTRLDLAQIATSYESQNQHLLYSLLARVAIVVLGDTPAALRLPAALFGVLSIWATWLLGRELLSRREALLAAALLAVSDLHVWFSQNARGYSALLFFTLLASRSLLHALAGDRRRSWTLYALLVALGTYVHVTMLFVVAGHAAMVLRRRLPGDPRQRGARLRAPLVGFGLAALLILVLYAPIARDLLAVTAIEGRDGTIPQWSSSRWALGEALARLRDSFPRPWLAALALACAGAGVARVARRRPVLLELALLPVAVGLVVVVGSGHHVWPRLFFFASGFGALIVAAGALALGERGARLVASDRLAAHGGTAAGIALVAAVAAGLPGAYGPKQRHAEAIALVEASRAPGDAVVTAGPAARIVQEEYGRDWPKVATADELADVRRHAARTWLVHSFPIHLRARRPDVARMLDDDFVLVGRFAGTLGGGDVLVWRTR